jgi:succinate dehydrogenase / fumarate reductase flavoprotein subunit
MSAVCDVLIIGAGGAALRAALAAYEQDPGLDIVLATKGEPGHSGVTATACSDRMAFHATLPTTAPGGADAWRHHADDIYHIGGYVSDADLAAVLAHGGARAFDDLDRLGVPWVRRADGTVDQFVTDGSEYARACYTGPYTANHIEAALVRRLADTPVRFLGRQMVATLLHDAASRRVTGAALISQHTGEITAWAAGAVVLASGGAGQAFAVNVFPPDCTGDGHALAYRAGAELVNLEFIQIGLCSIATGLACSGSMMRALPRLVNDAGDEFLPRYMPGASPARIYETLFAKGASWPVSYDEPSHVIDIAVAQEQSHGRRVYMDYARNPEALDMAAMPGHIRDWYSGAEGSGSGLGASLNTPLARLQAINRPSIDWLAERGVRLEAGDMIEIAPAVQHFQGGVKIRAQAQTTLPGLYAAGEVAGGQHGANRPGGNALLDTQVFGRIAGESAARDARANRPQPMDDDKARATVQALFTADGMDAGTVRREVQAAMSAACGVYRTEPHLRELLAHLDEMARAGVRPATNTADLAAAVEALNILQVARMVAAAALERDESRGPHLRFEPDSLTPLSRDDEGWRRYLVVRRGQDGPTLERRGQDGPTLERREPVRC